MGEGHLANRLGGIQLADVRIHKREADLPLLFCLIRIHVVYYQHTHIPFPPALPIPGDPRDGADSGLSRSLRGNTFPSACRLWMIAQEVLSVYNFAKAPISERVPLSFAEAKYQKLLVWVGGLDEGMRRAEDCPYEVIMFQ